MPAEFDACRKAGGKIRTVSGPSQQWGLSANEYLHICVRRNGSVVRGEKKTKVSITSKEKKT
jgi:hypothetical protein